MGHTYICGLPMGYAMGLMSNGASCGISCGTSYGMSDGIQCHATPYGTCHMGHPMNTLLDVLYRGHPVQTGCWASHGKS